MKDPTDKRTKDMYNESDFQKERHLWKRRKKEVLEALIKEEDDIDIRLRGNDSCER